jgi:antitoxin VapB
MQTAKIFICGGSQAVRLPKECRFAGTEVGIKKIGDMVVLYPQARADDLFYSSLGSFTEDFYESAELARTENLPQIRRETP